MWNTSKRESENKHRMFVSCAVWHQLFCVLSLNISRFFACLPKDNDFMRLSVADLFFVRHGKFTTTLLREEHTKPI